MQARRFVRRCAQQCGLAAERLDDVVQAAAELLVSGGDAHRPTAVALRASAKRITVVVDLTGPDVLCVQEDAEALLTGLCRRWGWRRLPTALQVWCEVPRSGARGMTPAR